MSKCEPVDYIPGRQIEGFPVCCSGESNELGLWRTKFESAVGQENSLAEWKYFSFLESPIEVTISWFWFDSTEHTERERQSEIIVS